MNKRNFLQQTEHLVTGGVGFLVDRPVHLGDFRDDNAGEPVDEGSAPTLLATGISWNDADGAFLWFNVPDDYDDVDDALFLHMFGSCVTANTGDTLDVTSAIRYRSGDVAAGIAVTITQDAMVFNSTTIVERTTDLSGLDLEGGDSVRFLITAANSGASEIIMPGAVFRYRSDLVLHTQSER